MRLTRRTALVAAAAAGLWAWRRQAARSRRLDDLAGRVVLVTGGSRGLGLALAHRYAAEGARVAICGRDAATLERARSSLEERGADVLAVPCDVGDAAQVDAMVAAVTGRFGGIDIVVNNAGTITVGPLRALTRSDYDEALRVNFWGMVHTSLAALPVLRRRVGARIVNVTSIGGLVPLPHLLPYTASKFAAVGFSDGLRAELAGEGIVVVTVTPGLMRTGSPEHARFKGNRRAEYAWFTTADALPGLSVSAERAAALIVAATLSGQPRLAYPLVTHLASWARGIAPALVADVAAVAGSLLPRARGVDAEGAPGHASHSALAPSPLSALHTRAAQRLNQTVPAPAPA